MADDLGEARRKANLRLECLRIAQHYGHSDPAQIVQAAREFADFVIGEGDAKIIDAAARFADAVRGQPA